MALQQTGAVEITRETLERCLQSLNAFECPSHHLEHYLRTEAATYLLLPGNVERVVFVEMAAFAPICADLVPDSGVAFLRCQSSGPLDLAHDVETGRVDGSGLFVRLWDESLGTDFPPWVAMADRAPVIFVRLGESVCTEGRWHWAPLPGPHQAITYPDVAGAFAALEAQAREAGDEERLLRLEQWRVGVLEPVLGD
jgi:hypothetical protein